MTPFLALLAAVLFACSLFMVLSRNVVRMLLGLSMLTTAVNLMLFQAGRFASSLPPLIPEGAQQLGESANPLPQALVLTAIVIGFALTIVCAILALRLWKTHRTLRVDDMQAAAAVGDPLAEEDDHVH